MKKLLLLGGSRYLLPVIEAAHKLDCYVITCDYLPHNIAHQYSDEYCNASIIDKELILNEAQKRNIDGIMSFACDPGVTTCAYVAEKMGLPSCGPYDSVCILQNKRRFRSVLQENGFQVPTAGGYKSIDEAMAEIERFDFPVIVKPVDSAGSKGVTRIDAIDRLKDGISKALEFSPSKEFIVEEFIEKDGYSSDSDCFSVNGNLKIVSFTNQCFDNSAANPYTPASYSWPSSICKEHQEELASEVQRLLTILNMGTSLYNVETRVGKNGKAYLMEVSPRGGGNRLSEMLRLVRGVDLITNAVKAALGEPVSELIMKKQDGFWAEVILHAGVPGRYKELWIDDSIRKYVVEKDLWVKEGDMVRAFTGANEAIGTLIFQFDREDLMWEVVKNTKKWIRIEC